MPTFMECSSVKFGEQLTSAVKGNKPTGTLFA